MALSGILTRREAEGLLEIKPAGLQHHLNKGNIKPCKVVGEGRGAVQLFWERDVLNLKNPIYDGWHTIYIPRKKGGHALSVATKFLFMEIPGASHHKVTASESTKEVSRFDLDVKDWNSDTIEKATVTVDKRIDVDDVFEKINITWNKEIKYLKSVYKDELGKLARKEHLEDDMPMLVTLNEFEKKGIDYYYWENDFLSIEDKFWGKGKKK